MITCVMINNINQYKNMNQTGKTLNQRAVPIGSPYYDRLRSLNIELDFTPYGSPEYTYLQSQIEEMQKRAQRHMDVATFFDK